ncbi:MAG: MBL fold metallo-hydrolase [Gemmatimonadota bacterium]|nr:MBL fold metallo-hydrolase [Gemmatimonadota bacterium]
MSNSNRTFDSRTVGDVRVTALDAGRFRLDGGTMFGVVPRSIWEKKIPPDERNRIQLGLNCLLVETGAETVLVETGIGAAKLSTRYRNIYGADPSLGVIDALAEAGIAPEAVDRVVLTHLHMDHAGGTTVRTNEGYKPAFPNARYIVQRQEWEDALGADRQTVRGYNAASDLLPLERAGVLELVEGDVEVCRGVRVFLTPGHTRSHQSVLVQSGGEAVCFIGDLVPTRHHLHPVYIMAFDLYPRKTFKVRQQVLKQAAGEGWLVAWPHDPEQVWAYITIDDRGEYTPVEEL